MDKKRIVVGMSGGVDSSISLLLLKQQGWSPVGVTLKLAHWEHPDNILGENVCCTAESLDISKKVCEKLGVEHHLYDVSDDFKDKVMGYFISEMRSNRTPNPCLICNRQFKFKNLLEWADKNKIHYIATGHYAKTCLNTKTGKVELLQPKDLNKDQTYGLSFLQQEQLRRIVFPLGNITKEKVYRIAKEQGLALFLQIKESQDLCFMSPKALPAFIRENVGSNPGPIKDEMGRLLGEHKGLPLYTIGQRRGIGLSKRYFVKRLDKKGNSLIVVEAREDIVQSEILLAPTNLISGETPRKKQKVLAKIRYRQPMSEATLFPVEDGKLRVVFDTPQQFVTPGQFCVFYDQDVCLGGGVINAQPV